MSNSSSSGANDIIKQQLEIAKAGLKDTERKNSVLIQENQALKSQVTYHILFTNFISS